MTTSTTPDLAHPGLPSALARVELPKTSSAVASLVPTAVFLAIDRWWGLAPAMVAASVASVALIVLRRRGGSRVGLFLPLSLAYVVVKAIAGVVTESQVVYFGSGLVLSAFLALAVGATAFTGTPVASRLLPLVTPYRAITPDHPTYRRVSAQVTAIWAVAELGVTGWEAWHLTAVSASEFVVARTIVAWPAMAVLVFLLIAYARFRLDRHEFQLRSATAD